MITEGTLLCIFLRCRRNALKPWKNCQVLANYTTQIRSLPGDMDDLFRKTPQKSDPFLPFFFNNLIKTVLSLAIFVINISWLFSVICCAIVQRGSGISRARTKVTIRESCRSTGRLMPAVTRDIVVVIFIKNSLRLIILVAPSRGVSLKVKNTI